jgi:predicted GNAT superfamily acetyltransferase
VTTQPPRRTAHEVEVRALASDDDYRQCVALQKLTWGDSFSETVPPAILRVTQRIGGVAAGAFDENGRMLGFVFGLTGIEQSRPVHWSDMLAVLPAERGRGIGRLLKGYQRDRLRELQVDRVYWSFDPLVARNAHLNLEVLGTSITEYVVDMYGSDPDGPLHQGLGTDRVIAVWRLDEPTTRAGLGTEGFAPSSATARQDRMQVPDDLRHDVEPDLPTIVSGTGRGPELDLTPLDGRPPIVAIEIPADLEEAKKADGELALRWRRSTREAFLNAFERGYRVREFQRETRQRSARYLLGTAD